MESPEFDGKDLSEALDAASKALGVAPADLDYEILEGGRKGVFGLGARPVRIRVSPSAPQPGRSNATGASSPEPSAGESAASSPAATLRDIVQKMGFDIKVEELRRDGSLELRLDGPDCKRLTAKDGELLSAMEFVLSRMGRRAWPDESPVHLTCRGFRSERDDEIVEMVRQAAAEVARSGRPHRLQALNPYERRVVHMTIRDHPGLTTVSEGDGFLKRVRVEKIAP
jgi:spoIIIJ-associated protein